MGNGNGASEGHRAIKGHKQNLNSDIVFKYDAPYIVAKEINALVNLKMLFMHKYLSFTFINICS